MTTRFHRRRFLKHAATLAGAAAGSQLFHAPHILAQGSPNSKINVAVIGPANQGWNSVNEIIKLEEKIVAFCDVDDKQFAKTQSKLSEAYPDFNFGGVQKFYDYRKMIDKLGKQIDAVFVCIPDHHHAVCSLLAMQAGKSVFCEKPLAHSIHECRVLAAAAKKYKVTTQLGNQGHSKEGVRILCEFLWAGAIGNVTEIHAWAPTGRGGTGARRPTKPAPATLHWDEWIGPAPFRDYHDELHPALWRSWWDFGSGSLGDWGCHNLDGAFWALNLAQPASVEAVERVGGSTERFPLVNVVRWDFPERTVEVPKSSGAVKVTMSPVKVFWYDGYRAAKTANPQKELGEDMEKSQNRPPLVLELEKKFNRNFGDGGTIYVGDKGMMYSSNYCDAPRIIPEEKMQQFLKESPRPEKVLPRRKGINSHQEDFLRAMREGKPAASDFEYGARLTELLLIGTMAERVGVGKKVPWDPEKMESAAFPELQPLFKRTYRKGWELPTV